MENLIVQKSAIHFSELEKHQIIQEYLSSHCTKVEIWEKYTGEKQEHGKLLRWMQALGYRREMVTKRSNIVANYLRMPEKLKEDEDFENLQLRKRIIQLEKQLKDAELRAIAFSTMVDIAEEVFKIPIRKKLNTKPSKS